MTKTLDKSLCGDIDERKTWLLGVTLVYYNNDSVDDIIAAFQAACMSTEHVYGSCCHCMHLMYAAFLIIVANRPGMLWTVVSRSSSVNFFYCKFLAVLP